MRGLSCSRWAVWAVGLRGSVLLPPPSGLLPRGDSPAWLSSLTGVPNSNATVGGMMSLISARSSASTRSSMALIDSVLPAQWPQ